MESNSSESEQHESQYTMPELPDDWKSGLNFEDRLKEKRDEFTEDDRSDAWKKENEAVKTYRDELVKRWVDEMDALLVFAGLFSTVLTAFNVESYSLLEPTKPDPVLAALSQVSAQLASFSVHNPFINSTQPAFQPSFDSSESSSPPRWAVWLNALWFSSLICSLSAASVAIMVKQWISEYNSRISGTTTHATRLRQHRYNGLVKWKVAEIMAVLPILLQIAFGLFLAGILILLWTLSRPVAIIASALVGALLAFTLMTIILPTFASNCAYLSPLSIALCRVGRLIYTLVRRLMRKAVFSVYLRAPSKSILERISKRLWDTFGKSLPSSVYAMQLAYVKENPLRLDQDIFIAAYHTTGDLRLLEQVSICFGNHPLVSLSEFLVRIHAQNRDYGQPESLSTVNSHWTQSIPLDMASDMLFVEAQLRMVDGLPGQTKSTWPEMAGHYLYGCHAILPRGDERRISYGLSNMATALYNNGHPHPDSFPLSQCLSTVRTQMGVLKKAETALPDIVRRRVVAAIYTVLRSRNTSRQPEDAFGWAQSVICLHILTLCISPSTSHSQRGDIAEEDTGWKPLTDAMVMAEEKVIKTFESRVFRDKENREKCFVLNMFFKDYRDIGLELLAQRISERMLRTLMASVRTLPESEPDFGERWKHGLLEWLNLLETERAHYTLTRPIAAEDDHPKTLSGIA